MNKLPAPKPASQLIIGLIDAAVAKPDTYPDPIALAILRNDLRKTVELATGYLSSLEEIDSAIRHVGSRISENQIKAVLKRWGKK